MKTHKKEEINMKYTDLESFLNAYIEIQKACCKLSTIKNMRAAANLLLAFFGNKKDISEITLIDGENFAQHLKSKGYAPATISRAMQRTIAFFKFAQKSKVLVDNPFSGIKLMRQTYPARIQFIDQATFLKVLDHCPNTQWKLIVSLARVSGIRIPSELVGLTWECIHWDKNTMTVPSPKTEHIKGREFREVPLFPEIKSLLLDAYKNAPKNEKKIFPTVLTLTNLKRGLTQIIENAGVPVWENLFHNLRASRASELFKDYPLNVVISWLGIDLNQRIISMFNLNQKNGDK
jgi:integrase